MTLPTTFRTRLAQALDGHKRAYIAHRSGYSESYIRRVIRGDRTPTLSFVDAMAGALGISVISLLTE